MPFFIRNSRDKKTSSKRKKAPNRQNDKVSQKSEKRKKKEDEVISSDEELSDVGDYQAEGFSSEEETEQEKKLRLTKKYIEQIENEEREKNQLEDARDAVSQRLNDEALEERGRLQKKRAHEYENVSPEVLCIFRGHKLSVTCIVISHTEKFMFSGSKDCSIIKWSIEDKKRLQTIPGFHKKTEGQGSGHVGHVLALALSTDDKFLASGGQDNLIHIWNPETMKLIKILRGHRKAITGLVFEKNSHQLISASSDRSLKLWDLDQMGYVESLFGHQDSITGLDCFFGKIALTSGGRDNSIRLWKIVEESQLVFQGSGSSIDCVCASSFQCFISGSDDGTLCYWGTNKKKPMTKITAAHGHDSQTEEANWIVSLSSLQNTDLVASGSKDGFIRLWRRDDEAHTLVPVYRIPATGFINAMQFTPSGRYLAAGIGQEHKLGSWWRLKDSKNSIVIYSWPNQ